MDYNREAVYKREILAFFKVFFKVFFSQERKYSTTNRRWIKVGTNVISLRNITMFCISNFPIPFATHCLKIVKAKFENFLVNISIISCC